MNLIILKFSFICTAKIDKSMTSKSLHMARKNFIFAQKWNRFSDFKLCTSLQEACEH